MAKIEIYLPAMGEGIHDAQITKWLIKEGDTVEEDQAIVEVATDKVDSEIPAPTDGVISKIVKQEGESPKIGELLAIMLTDGDDAEESESENPIQITETETIAAIKTETKANVSAESAMIGSRTLSGNFISPLVRNIATQEGIGIDELDSIQGTGLNSRLTKNDIFAYLENKDKTPIEKPVVKESKHVAELPKKVVASGNPDIVEMDRMRKLIADHMVESKRISPHVTSFVEIDVTNLVNWRNAIKADFQKRENAKITFTPIFIEACVKALKDFPMVNVSVDGSNILVKKDINIGMAAALPNGNLIVPVIKNAADLNLAGIAKRVNDLANRARNNKLKPDEIQGGTFTITNFGSFGNISGTPIINQPEVAILGVGAIKKKPAVIETPEGDFIGIRHIMILSLSYDHRVVDGALGGMFLKRIGDYLEQFDTKRTV